MTRKCVVCKKEKDISEFWEDKRCSDGILRWCSDCHRVGAHYKKITRKEHMAFYQRKRRQNPMVHLSSNISTAIWVSLKGNKKGHWESLVGYNLEQLKQYLEKRFKKGMTWGNYGEWHLDHIIPKSAFNFSKPEHIDFKRCWALSNLQPLWKTQNLIKHNILVAQFQPSFAF